ncbi:hypothetical protein J4G33_10140 [Actinotalea sp. BY-33]|uniref:Uncharacterized protein n=1 Tax=Actinotalea soli TaxID=2819234 RepID=A0A939LPW1_9CELL|nr:hypothetical protein [Actinotalea soli]MBO1752161.1 hypothetical protein [Actinotalea soli]
MADVDEAQAVILGAQIAGVVAVTVAMAGIVGQGLLEWRRRKHEALLAAEQRKHELAVARANQDHARAEKRYDDLKSAYVRFAAEMRRVVLRAEGFELDQYLRGDDYTPEPDPWDTEVEAEQALADLRLLVDDQLYGAGRDWLDHYYMRYWRPDPRCATPDVEGAEARFIAEAKRLLGLVS